MRFKIELVELHEMKTSRRSISGRVNNDPQVSSAISVCADSIVKVGRINASPFARNKQTNCRPARTTMEMARPFDSTLLFHYLFRSPDRDANY